MPVPESYYVSPLKRCCETAMETFSALSLPPERTFRPIVKEVRHEKPRFERKADRTQLLREQNGARTCDRRSARTEIQRQFPAYQFESGFAESDEFWDPNRRETDLEVSSRLQAFLDDLFEHDENAFISLTTHSGAIRGLLSAIKHRPFRLERGGAMPMLVKAERRT